MAVRTRSKTAVSYTRLVLKYLFLVVSFFAIYMLVNFLLPSGIKPPSPEEAGQSVLMLFVTCLLLTLVTGLTIQLSPTGGWKLVLGLVAPLFLDTTVLTQIEIVLFGADVGIPTLSLWLMAVQSLLRLMLFVPLAVWVLGKMPRAAQWPAAVRFDYPWHGWAWRLALIAGFFVLDYWFCGFFIAWQIPAVREYYSGGAHIDLQIVLATQFVRGLLWAIAAVPVIKVLRGRTLETAIVAGLLLSFYHAIGLIMPNGFMPAAVRQAHLVELLISIFAVGFVSGLVLRARVSTRSEAEIEPQSLIGQPASG